MTRRSAAVLLSLLFTATLFAIDAPRLDSVEPFRLKVQPSGWASITVNGYFPTIGGHPNMDQYEHWFVRRDGGAWQLCTRGSSTCRTAGWSGSTQTLELNAAHWLTSPGTLEIRMNEGLSEDGNSSWPFSNVAEVPVLAAFGAPPMVVSMSKKEFVSGGPEGEFVFRIAANNFDPESTVVVFRGDTVVRPIRIIDGSVIEVAVPPNYRNGDGELSLQLRTNSGGYSANQFFKVLKNTRQIAGTAGIRPIEMKPRVMAPVAPAGITPLKISPNVALANRVRKAIVEKLGAEAAGAIAVSANAGVVTLTGTAASADLRAAAEAATASTAGVKQVVNEIGVR